MCMCFTAHVCALPPLSSVPDKRVGKAFGMRAGGSPTVPQICVEGSAETEAESTVFSSHFLFFLSAHSNERSEF